MIVITLGAYREHEPDHLGRTAGGWKPGLSDEKVWDNARGRWAIGPRGEGQRYVLIVAGGEAVKGTAVESHVCMAAEIHALSEKDADGLRAIDGTVLGPGHEVFDPYVGKPSPVRSYGGPRYYTSSHIQG